jgi:hypothetical protein
MLATVCEQLDLLNRQIAMTRGVKSHQLGRPLRIRRPGEQDKPPANVVSIADFVGRNRKQMRG